MKRMYRQEFGNRRNFANDEISSIGLRKKVSSRGEQNEDRYGLYRGYGDLSEE